MASAFRLFELRSRRSSASHLPSAIAVIAVAPRLLFLKLKCCNLGQYPAASLLIVKGVSPQLASVRLPRKTDHGALVSLGIALTVMLMP